ncbi:MAG TPA: amidohydrolase family protein [Gemmatimonadaceae bacterium]|nr:amidohydrolase family protein [Gemmatimonadaceae bacterium]
MQSIPARALLLAALITANCARFRAEPSVATIPGVSALRFAALVDGTGELTPDAIVFVAGDTIVRVASGDAALPPGIPVTDLRPLTAIPGMIDAHTHMTYWRDKANDPMGQRAPRSRDSIVMMAAENARRTLETGVTTVRDLGAANYNDIAMRDSINKGAMTGPRMFVSGFGLSKFGGGGRGGPALPGRGQVRDTNDLLPAITAQVEAGADWIKMYGSTGSFQNVTGRQTFTNAEMRVAVATAHKLGKRIAIHSYGDSGGRAAMQAGAESVEHPAGVDDITLVAWARTNTFYVPTVDHNRFYAENAALLRYNAQQVAALDSFRALNLETVRRAAKAGVKIAMGSDAVYWMHGENTTELRRFIEAGMTPAQALETATVNGGALLGMPKKLGRVARGFYADIVAVDGNPLTDIEVVIRRVKWVMKGGKVVVDKR